MKRCFALILLLLLAAGARAQAQNLDDEYLQIFGLIQEGDSLAAAQPTQALAKYSQAQGDLQKLQKENPGWNATIVNFRLSYVADRIQALGGKVPPAPVASGATNSPQPSVPVVPARPSAPADWEQQLSGLKGQVRQLQQDKGLLEAKLKEAFAAQLAQVDPHEFARAEDRIKALEKENELMKVTLEQDKAKPAAAVDTKALEQARQALADSNRQLEAQKASLTQLTLEKESLENRLKAVNPESGRVAALKLENQALARQLAEAKAAPAAAGKSEATASQSAQAQTQIASLQSEKEALRLENAALEDRVKKLTSTTVSSRVLPPSSSPEDLARIRDLERERDAVQKKLEASEKALYGRKGKVVAGQVEQLEGELATLRARVEIFEARQVPYSAEELALLKTPQTRLVQPAPNGGKKSVKELPAGSAKMISEAQGYFAAKQYDKAEAIYTQVLSEDPKNVPVLANLAAIQVEARHFDAADLNLRQALAVEPQDAYSLYVLGYLRFRQARYDEALDALSRGANLDPQNPEIQNYLGLTLAQKGLRGPAEVAFRKAIELQPTYASAHVNLAVFYITQNPPYRALARWHYQKALDSGSPHNPTLEKLLEDSK